MLERRFFKTDSAFQGFSKLHPKMQEVAKFAVDQAILLGVENPVITETVTTKEIDKALGRVSVSHQQGRAVDLRTWNMTDAQLVILVNRIEVQYGHIGAFNRLLKRQLVVYHDIGKGPHLHLQLDRSFAVGEG